MTSKTVSRPKSGNLCPGNTGGKPGAARFTRMLAVETVPDTGLDIKVCANAAERTALAETYGLAALQTFQADFYVRKQDRARFKVGGVLQALVTQTCVVSLEPFEALVRADIDVDFAPSGEPTGPLAAFASRKDPPDPIIGGHIDLGALAGEFLALNLDPYPRKPGVVFEETNIGGEPSGKDSPFAVLRPRS